MLKHAESIRANYGNDVLDLTAASRYVERLLTNDRIHRYLAKHHQETLTTLEQILAEIDADRKRAGRLELPSAVNGSGEFRDSAPTSEAVH